MGKGDEGTSVSESGSGADLEIGRWQSSAMKVGRPLVQAFWRLRVTGLDHLPESGPAILCPNHTSVLDSFFLPITLPRRITYVGKAEYLDDWKTRRLFPALGMIPIDREGGEKAERALTSAGRILDKGELFGIYPEGTRSRTGLLYRGHTGPARLALRHNAPLIPIGIRGMREIQAPEDRFPKPFMTADLAIGEPIWVDSTTGKDNDRRLLRRLIDEVMFEIRELSGQDYVDRYATAPEPDVEQITVPGIDADINLTPADVEPDVEVEISIGAEAEHERPTVLEDRRSSASVLSARPLLV